jgi:II/X family phage/plasmid replication protein
MIDMLVLRCPIRKTSSYSFDSGFPVLVQHDDFIKLSDLKIPLEASICPDGEQIGLVHKWESIPSSYSNLAFKVFDFRGSSKVDIQDFFIEIKASPAKIMHGHNLYGSDDLWSCAQALIHLFIETYPVAFEYLDSRYWSVEQVDITYHSWCKSEREAVQFVNALQNVSNGQTRGATSRAGTVYSGTAYFGKKNSRIKKIKVYVKLLEVLNNLTKAEKSGDKKNLKQFYPQSLLDWAVGMVRWESSVKTRWFERRGYSTNLFELCKTFNAQEFWKESTLDIFKALKGKEMRLIKDENVEKDLKERYPTISKHGTVTYTKAIGAYRVYRAIKSEGWIEAKRTYPNGVFYRAIEMLQGCGLSKAVLQNLQGDGIKCEVIPFIRFIEINFNEQTPAFLRAA